MRFHLETFTVNGRSVNEREADGHRQGETSGTSSAVRTAAVPHFRLVNITSICMSMTY